MKKNLKIIFTTVLITLLVVASITVIILFNLMNNKGDMTSESSSIYSSSSEVISSSSSSEDISRYIDITNNIKNNLEKYSSISDSKKIDKIVSVSYSSFSLLIGTLLDSNEIRIFNIDILLDISIDTLLEDFNNKSNYQIKGFTNYSVGNHPQESFKGYAYDIDESIYGICGIYLESNSYRVVTDNRYNGDTLLEGYGISNNINGNSLYYSYISYLYDKN